METLININITDSDDFINMPASVQALYFHLCGNADECYVEQKEVLKCIKKANADYDDLVTLENNNFVIFEEKGILVVDNSKLKDYLKEMKYGRKENV